MVDQNKYWKMIATIAVGLSAVVPQLQASSPVQPKLIHPSVYESPDAKYSLSINPSDRFGFGPAECKFVAAESGDVMWEKSLPFTFRDAVVTNEGSVFGFGYSGRQGLGAREAEKMWIVLLDSKGEEVMSESRKMHRGSYFLHPPTLPDADPLAFDGVGRVLVPMQGELWRIYDLTDGSLRGAMTPNKSGERRRSFHGAKWIPNTDLLFALWINWSDYSSRFLVFRLNGDVLWSLETGAVDFKNYPGVSISPTEISRLISMREVKGEDDDPFGSPSGSGAEYICAEFELGLGDREERRTYAVTYFPETDAEDPFSGEESKQGTPERWEIGEIAKKKWSPEPQPGLPPLPGGFEPIVLEQLGEFSLKARDRGGEVRKVAVGFSGRIYAVEESAGAVRVFSEEGEFLHACVPSRAPDAKIYACDVQVVEDNEGSVHIGPGRVFHPRKIEERDLPKTHLRFDRDGRSLKSVLTIPTGFSAALIPVRGENRLWVAAFDRVTLVKPDGEKLVEIERRFDGEWMGFPTLTVGPAGEVAVASGLDSNFSNEIETNAIPRTRPENIVSLFDKHGKPLRSIDIDGFPNPSLAYDGERLILTREEGIFFVSATDGKPLGWFKMEIDDHQVSVVSGGKELLVISPKQGQVVRYRMPK